MSDRGTTIVVDVHDALPDVLDRLRPVGGGSARLVIPAESSLFLTAIEFRTLKEVADSQQLRLSVETADPLRAQLSAMFGLADAASDSPASPTEPVKPAGERRPALAKVINLADRARRSSISSGATKPGEQPVPARPTPVGTVAPPPPSPPAADESASKPTKIAAAPSVQASSPATTRPAPPVSPPIDADAASGPPMAVAGSPRPRIRRQVSVRRPHPSDASPKGRSERQRVADAPRQTPDAALPGPRRWPRWVPLLAAIVVAALIALAGTAFFLPRATVAISLKRQPVSGELVYRIGAPGSAPRNDPALIIAAEPVSGEATFEASTPTTGVRLDPDAKADGEVRLSNPNPKEIVIEQGTTITTIDDIPYVFAKRVVVPAGDAKAGHYGRASAPVQAARGGSAGNRDIGDLGGRLASGVYYSNRERAITGGTDRKVRVVGEDDLAALRAKADAALRDRVADAIGARVGPSGQIIPDSLALGDIRYTFDHQAGQEATNVALQAALPATALAFDAKALHDAVAQRFREQFATLLPAGYTVNGADVKLGEPIELVTAADGIEYRVAGAAQASARFTEADRQSLRRALRGKDATASAAILRATSGIDDFSIHYTPDWLPHRMPRATAGISIETTS